MRSFWFGRFCLVVFSLFVFGTVQAQTVPNGNFEGGFMDGLAHSWNGWKSFGYVQGAFSAGTDHYVSASHSQKFNCNQPTDGGKHMAIYQVINAKDGGTYQVTINHRSFIQHQEQYGCETMTVELGLDPRGGTYIGSSNIEWHFLNCGRNNWHQETKSIQAQSCWVTIYVRVHRKGSWGGNGAVWIDDIGISGPPPDPTYTPTVTVTPTPTYPIPVGGELVINGSFEDGFTNNVGNGWTSFSTNGNGYWKRSTLIGPAGGGNYLPRQGAYETMVELQSRVILLGAGFGAADDLANEETLSDTLIVGRTHYDHAFGEIYYGDYQAAALWLANHYEVEAGYHPRVDIWAGVNEPDWGSDNNWQRTLQFETYFTQLMHERNLKSVVLNLATGNPGDRERILWCKDLFDIADYVGYHTYGGPNDQLMVLRYDQGTNVDDPHDYALRFRGYEEMYRHRGWRFPPVIYTEGTTFHGWRGSSITAANVRDDMIAFIPYMNADRWVAGLTIFAVGGGGAWEAWEIIGQNIAGPVGQANQADPHDKMDGLYSQMFGVGTLRCVNNVCNHDGVFTGGIVQSVTGLAPGQTHRLGFEYRYEYANGLPDLTFQYGLDWTGQTNNPNSRTINWSGNLIALDALPHDTWKYHYATFAAESGNASIWFRSGQNLERVSYRIALDAVSLRQVSGQAPPTNTFGPTNTNTHTPVSSPTPPPTQAVVEDHFVNSGEFDANWTAYGGSPSRYLKNEYWCGGPSNYVEIQSSNGGYYRVFTEGSAGGTYTLTLGTVRGNGVRYIRVDSNGGTNPGNYDRFWNSNEGSWNCENPGPITGTVGPSGAITVFLGTTSNGQYRHLRIVFDPPEPGPTGTHTPTPVSTPPCQNDYDGDGVCDEQEMGPSVHPGRSNLYLPDSDGDGLLDGLEDINRNGVRDPGETGARLRDSDGDGFEDGIEVLFTGSDPQNPSVPGTAYNDSDGDGLPDFLDSNDGNPDTDGDRYLDGFDALWFQALAAANDAGRVPRLGNVNETPSDPPNTVDNADCQMVLNFFANRPTGGYFSPLHSDVNRDAYIDNADSQLILQFFARTVPHLPYIPRSQ